MKYVICLLLIWFLVLQSIFTQPIEVFRLDLLNEIYRNTTTLRSHDSPDPFILESNFLPLDKRFYPTVTNGYIGHQIFSNHVFLNYLFNGKEGESHKAQIPIQIPKPLFGKAESERFVLDIRKNIFFHRSFSESINLEQAIYAHSWYGRLLVVEISSSSKLSESFELLLDVSQHDVTSNDVTFTNTTITTYNSSLCGKPECKYLLKAKVTTGHTNIAEQEYSNQQELVIVSTVLPPFIVFSNTSAKHIFFFAFGNFLSEALFFYELGLKNVESENLMTKHIDIWGETFRDGSVDVLGSLTTDRSIKSAFYYLLSSFPTIDGQINFPFPFYGVAPSGLARGAAGKDYQGHVFWDQDFWMIPGLLPFYPEIARMAINYRIRNLAGALVKAVSLGYKGAAYPWEAGFTGADVCPGTEYITGEIHVTADVIFMLKQYVYMTNDFKLFSKLLSSSGCKNQLYTFVGGYSCQPIPVSKPNECVNVSAWDMLRETAQFWHSRSKWNPALNKFVINNVMGPDEYQYPVNNSVFTNVIASQNLKFAADIAEKLGICSSLVTEWRNVSNNLLILFDQSISYHPEFDGFNSKTDVVKQADTIMIGFPLLLNMTDTVRKNDLTIYETLTTSKGPAMTWGMFSTNWLALSNEQKASGMFLRQFENIQSPFNIWSENSDGGGAVNFLTGMGGFLQNVVYGYFGLRVNKYDLTLNPRLLPTSNNETVNEMTLNGLRYRGVLLNINVYPSLIEITYAGIYHQDTNDEICVKVTIVSSEESQKICQQFQSVTVNLVKVKLTVITQ